MCALEYVPRVKRGRALVQVRSRMSLSEAIAYSCRIDTQTDFPLRKWMLVHVANFRHSHPRIPLFMLGLSARGHKQCLIENSIYRLR